jgi:hypothetical protein
MAIFERLAALEPASTGWQRDLAVAHGRVGILTPGESSRPVD